MIRIYLSILFLIWEMVPMYTYKEPYVGYKDPYVGYKEPYRDTGWIILSVVFLLIIIGAIIVIVYCLYLLNEKPAVCFGSFGVQPRTGARVLNQCAPNRRTPCSYHSIGGLQGAIQQCNLLATLCDAFIYDATLDTMAIVDRKTTFSSAVTDLYVRQ
jgi:hypothetical protein